jgi:uncharacterized membrane protein
MIKWKYMKDGQSYGPVDADVLIGLLRAGTLTPDSLVMKENGVDWAPARAFPELGTAATAGATAPLDSSIAAAGDTSDIEKNKVFAVLAYLGILFLVPLLAAKDSKFARYHTNQGIVLFLAFVVAYIAIAIMGHIPFVGCLVLVLFPVVSIGHLVFIVLGIINAVNGKYKPLPLIGQFTILK